MPVATMLKFPDVQCTCMYSVNDSDCCDIISRALIFFK